MTEQSSYTLATSAADKAAVIRLRDQVYVQDQGRLDDAGDMAATFDRFDAYADYILARLDGEPVGCIKVVRDSELGLPCQDVADLTEFKDGHRVVELGHLMTRPDVRHQMLGMALMREGLLHGIRHGATRLVGDFFVDDTGELRGFYRSLGFVALCKPYPDERFAGAPLSLVGGLDFAGAADRVPGSHGKERQLLEYFFGDYAERRRTYLEQADGPALASGSH
ncbi:GNAT family N-acetyltransferase [Streptomyces sp. NPDC048278]|uniref:GNAT family N-acetyltransferase n=1 Tax=unclassified Streptomyces TaxID=2593676 RepID=UPI003424236C